jgi:mono/diheme cytochrome c family protein
VRRGRREAPIALALSLALVTSARAAEGDAPTARHDYLMSCAGCHTLDGGGSAHVPSLHGIGSLLARTGGRAYVTRVPGVASAPISDARLAALLNWVCAEFGGGAPTPPFEAAEVAKGRAEPFADPRAARAALRP